MRKSLLFLLFLLPVIALAQKPKIKFQAAPEVHFRTFWMSTNYTTPYKDDYALGSSLKLGANLKYTKNLEFRIGYRMSANLWSSKLTEADPLSGGFPRYELGLFDLQHPRDRFFGNLEILSLTYSKENFGVSIGKMGINTDWINAQDGRLAPTAIEGAKIWISTAKKWKLTAWGIGRINVRGSRAWLGVGESIGVFPVARGIDGKPSRYKGNTQSEWIGLMELDKKWEGFELHLSNVLVQNISNTIMAQTQRIWEKENSSQQWLLGLQLGFQHGVGNGGNSDPSLRYKDPEDRNWSISTRLGYDLFNWKFHLNYTKVGGEGRWLSPREWGKDVWYTFIPRERNEGNASFDAVLGYAEHTFSAIDLTAFVYAGWTWLPNIMDSQANKYNSPSYRQINFGLKYRPKMLDRIDAQIFVMNKEQIGNEMLKPVQEYNKVGMMHVNAIVNWRLN